VSDVTNKIPRSDLTIEQRRRLGSLQAAAHLIYGTSYNVTVDTKAQWTHKVLALAEFIATGAT
jgi:hypothetical protein